jgi:hypothetical protein
MIGRLAALRRGARVADRVSDHALREQRLEQVRDAVDDFAYRLGLLIAGHEPSYDAAADDVEARLHGALRSFLARGDVMRPDFGPFGDLRVEGDLLRTSDLVLATLEFDDRCVRQTARGRLIPAKRRRVRLVMRVTLDPARVIDCEVSEVPARNV